MRFPTQNIPKYIQTSNFEAKHKKILADFVSIQNKMYVSWIMQHQV